MYQKGTQEILIGVGVAVIILFVNIVVPLVEGGDLIRYFSSISSFMLKRACPGHHCMCSSACSLSSA